MPRIVYVIPPGWLVVDGVRTESPAPIEVPDDLISRPLSSTRVRWLANGKRYDAPAMGVQVLTLEEDVVQDTATAVEVARRGSYSPAYWRDHGVHASA